MSGIGCASQKKNTGDDMADKVRHSAELIGQRIATLRKELGISRKDFAAAIGLGTESAISEIENGRAYKQSRQLCIIAETLGSTPNQLLGWTEEEPATTNQIEMMGAAVEVILMGEGWVRERAEAVVDIATEVAREKTELDLDRRLLAAFRRRALGSVT